MARIKYYRVPKPLPDADDVEGLGEYWLRYYNTGGKWGKGKGSIIEVGGVVILKKKRQP